MNREQRKYILERIENIAKTKRYALTNLNNKAQKTKWETDEKADVILKGEATLKSYEQIVDVITKPYTVNDLKYNHLNYFDFYDFPTFVPYPPVKNLDSRLAAITAEANSLKDACMLGDTIELLAKLSAFERKEF